MYKRAQGWPMFLISGRLVARRRYYRDTLSFHIAEEKILRGVQFLINSHTISISCTYEGEKDASREEKEDYGEKIVYVIYLIM